MLLSLLVSDIENNSIMYTGKGYNSIGTLCEGWAGNCGEGGKGASSWYLMCGTCREKYYFNLFNFIKYYV